MSQDLDDLLEAMQRDALNRRKAKEPKPEPEPEPKDGLGTSAGADRLRKMIRNRRHQGGATR